MELWCQETLKQFAQKIGLKIPIICNFENLIQANPNTVAILLEEAQKQLQWPIWNWDGSLNDHALKLAQRLGPHRGIIPITISDDILYLAPLNPFNQAQIKEIHFIVNQPIQWLLINPLILKKTATDIYTLHPRLSPKIDIEYPLSINLNDPSTLITWVNALLHEAVTKEASDIHIEFNAFTFLIRLRIQGTLSSLPTPEPHIAPYILSRLKHMAHLDTSEQILPQDGRFSYHYNNRKIDMRVSTIPTYQGESLVIRLLNPQKSQWTLKRLGISNECEKNLQTLVKERHGLILITGPTGSGKTTTAYALLNALDYETLKLITIEDPVEYDLPKAIQISVNEKQGLIFENVIKSILRHDPDILFIGEIRNEATAHLAIQAALTGHKVIATLHALDDLGAIPRLLELNIPEYLLKESIQAIVSQNLINKSCENCNTYGCLKCEYTGIIKRYLKLNLHLPPFS